MSGPNIVVVSACPLLVRPLSGPGSESPHRLTPGPKPRRRASRHESRCPVDGIGLLDRRAPFGSRTPHEIVLARHLHHQVAHADALPRGRVRPHRRRANAVRIWTRDVFAIVKEPRAPLTRPETARPEHPPKWMRCSPRRLSPGRSRGCETSSTDSALGCDQIPGELALTPALRARRDWRIYPELNQHWHSSSSSGRPGAGTTLDRDERVWPIEISHLVLPQGRAHRREHLQTKPTPHS